MPANTNIGVNIVAAVLCIVAIGLTVWVFTHQIQTNAVRKPTKVEVEYASDLNIVLDLIGKLATEAADTLKKYSRKDPVEQAVAITVVRREATKVLDTLRDDLIPLMVVPPRFREFHSQLLKHVATTRLLFTGESLNADVALASNDRLVASFEALWENR